jgi:hypothetical protein
VGLNADLQIPLMIIDQRGVSIMSTLFTNRRVPHLRFVDAFEWIQNTGGNIGHHRDYFEKYQNRFGVNTEFVLGVILE